MSDFKSSKIKSTIVFKTFACFLISGMLVSIVARLLGPPLIDMGVSEKLGVIFIYVLVFSITGIFHLSQLLKNQIITNKFFIKNLLITFAVLIGLGIIVFWGVMPTRLG